MQFVKDSKNFGGPMPVTFLRNGEAVDPEWDHPEIHATVEWINGQYWLHSDDPKERPIGIEIDPVLNRHLEYFRKSSIHKELFARAIGIKSGIRPRVLDLTGGLLGDSLLFLAAGCEVITLERHPLVAFLIRSAMLNAQHPLMEKWQFHQAEALAFLETDFTVDVIFFDPMFEDANHKSSPKKEMRIFRDLLSGDADAEKVLARARKSGAKRVVVKRPRLSRELSPDVALKMEGKSTRYDVYFS